MSFQSMYRISLISKKAIIKIFMIMLFLLRSLIVPANTIFFKPILDASMGYTTATDQLARFLKIVCSFHQLHSKLSTSQCNSVADIVKIPYFNPLSCRFLSPLGPQWRKEKHTSTHLHKMNFLYLSAWHFMHVNQFSSIGSDSHHMVSNLHRKFRP